MTSSHDVIIEKRPKMTVLVFNGRIYGAKPTNISIRYMPKIYTSVADVVRVTMCYYDVIIITGNGKNSIISTKLDIAPKRLQQNL